MRSKQYILVRIYLETISQNILLTQKDLDAQLVLIKTHLCGGVTLEPSSPLNFLSVCICNLNPTAELLLNPSSDNTCTSTHQCRDFL